jgi:hypothetical protein
MEDVKRNATKKLLALHADLLKRSFQLFYEWAQKCVTSKGDYFEEYEKICLVLNVVFLKFMKSWNLIV